VGRDVPESPPGVAARVLVDPDEAAPLKIDAVEAALSVVVYQEIPPMASLLGSVVLLVTALSVALLVGAVRLLAARLEAHLVWMFLLAAAL
jgi:hypothetical protein